MIDQLDIQLQKLRGLVLRPILQLFSAFGIIAMFLTNPRLVLGVMFLWLFLRNQKAATVLMIFTLFLDALDGALARFQNRASDRGKFLDTAVDYCVYAFILFVLPILNASIPLVMYNLFIIPVAYLFGVIKKNEGRSSDWIIHPASRLSYLKAIVVIPFFLLVLLDSNWLNGALWFANILATTLGLYYFVSLQRRRKLLWGQTG